MRLNSMYDSMEWMWLGNQMMTLPCRGVATMPCSGLLDLRGTNVQTETSLGKMFGENTKSEMSVEA